MKIKSLIALLLAGLFYFNSSCKKESAASADCVRLKIQQLQQEPKRNPPAEIWQYIYEDNTVYYIPPYCYDQYSELLDDHCRLLCAPDGGIAGTGDGTCSDFFSKRTNGILIWRDNR